MKRDGYDLVRLDDILPRLRAPKAGKPFVALTFDDGYRDLLVHALPVLEAHEAPFTAYVTTGFLDRTARLWWVELEQAIRARSEVRIVCNGRTHRFATGTAGEKQSAFVGCAAALATGDDAERLKAVAALLDGTGVMSRSLVDDLCMDWSELTSLAHHSLATIGCHTITHPRLARLDDATARSEMVLSRSLIAGRLGCPANHLCYPYGGADAAGPREFGLAQDLGFATAVTTRPGVLSPRHASRPTALPRLSLNGLWQTEDMLEVLLSGLGTALWNGANRLGLR